MIKNNQPLSISEAAEYVKKSKDREIDVAGFIKKFKKLNPKEAKELRKSIEELNLLKLNPKHISKIIDLLPQNATDLNKVLSDVNLDEDETKKVLETIKKFK